MLAALVVNFGSALRAQDWSKADVASTADFWGICHGGDQFIAVGSGGTILTSPDGSAWSVRASGTTEWLLGVARGTASYVVVGDHGTILTSPDGATWTPRSSGTTVRLNGVAFGGGRFLAVGENGTVSISTDDGLTWLPGSTGVSTFLRGVVYGRERFVLGGGGGTLLSTTDGQHFARLGFASYGAIESLTWDGSSFLAVGGFSTIARSRDLRNWEFDGLAASYLRGIAPLSGEYAIIAGNPAPDATLGIFGASGDSVYSSGAPAVQLNAVAVGASAVIAVGQTGTICRRALPAVPDRVWITIRKGTNRGDNSIYAGENVTLFAVAPPPSVAARFQWFHDGVPIAGATGATLVLADLRANDAGTYDVTVTTPAGMVSSNVYSGSYTLSVRPLAVYFGSRDRSFASPVTATPWAIAVQPDGGIVLAGPMFFYPRDVPQYGLARLHADGSVDETFQLPAGGLGLASAVRSIEVLADGRIAVRGDITRFGEEDETVSEAVFNSDGSRAQASHPSPSSSVALSDGRIIAVAIERNVVTLVRLNAVGELDASYPTVSFALGPLMQWSEDLNFSSFVYCSAEGGGFLVATSSNSVWGHHEAKLFRLLPDGRLDSSFTLATIPDVVVTKIVSARGHIYYQSAWEAGLKFKSHQSSFGRLEADGSVDSTYRRIDFDDGMAGFRAVALCPDGSFVTELFDGLYRFQGVERIAGSRLVNLSIRTTAGTGEQTLMAGFVVGGGGGSRAVLVRGVGPGLVPLGLGVNEVVSDPQLTLFHGSLAVARNDDWDAALNDQFAELGAFPLLTGSKDAALFSSLLSGVYTAHVTASTDRDGVALVEVYDAGPAPTPAPAPRLVNLSGRARVGTGNTVLIAGFVISGSGTKRVLIRAIGPGLVERGVADALADPKLSVYHGNTVVAENDNWDFADAATFRTVGAFDLTTARDAALVLDLPAGAYSAIVAGVNNTAGVALVEIYEVP